MSTAGVNIKGLAELKRALGTLPAKVESNIMRGAMRAGAKVLQERAKEAAPVDQGDLRDSIRVGTRARRGVVTASVKAGGKKAFHAGFVEFGTAAHEIHAHAGGVLSFNGYTVLSVNHPGAKPQPYMRPALDAGAEAAVRVAAEHIRTKLSTQHGIDVADPLQDGDE